MIPNKVSLILSPTPLHRLDRLSKELGVDLWIKRDDLTGFALGGNKGRKLEYLMAAVQASGADVVVTCGGAQSNFVRQLAAACAVIGVRCAAAVMALPYEDEPPNAATDMVGGNVLLGRILGLDMRVFPDDTWETLYSHAEEVAREYEAKGLKVFRIPIGGSSPLGAYAFLRAADEIESHAFDAVSFASSSGSTHTGLATAFKGSKTRVIGVACDPEPEIADDFAKLSSELSELVGVDAIPAEEFVLDFRFVGPGYGVPSAEGQDALLRLARTEGIFLDPIYSAKAFSGLLRMIEEGSVSGKVLFWHTGGVPALFTYSG